VSAERAEFVEGRAPLVRRLSSFGRSDPFSDGVSRQPGTLGYLVQREFVAEVHPPDFSQHFHADHPVFSCSESEQKQLNTWVSFQSAEQPLLGQFSVSGNRKPETSSTGLVWSLPSTSPRFALRLWLSAMVAIEAPAWAHS